MKTKECKYCGQTSHYSISCFNKPRRPLKHKSLKTEQRTIDMKIEWFEKNPPDKKGEWECYLQIHPYCPVKVNRDLLRLEHVKSRARHPELRYDVDNIKPSEDWCNGMKGSLDLEDLVKDHPHLAIYL